MAGNRRVWVLIPAAGESARFRAVGYLRPKPLLMIRSAHGVERPMLGHVLSQVPEYPAIVGLPEGAAPPLDVGSFSIVAIRNPVSHADTVRRLARLLPPAEDVITMDCDTLVSSMDIRTLLESHVLNGAAVTVATAYCSDPAMSRVDRCPIPSEFVDRGPPTWPGVVSVRVFRRAGELAASKGETMTDIVRNTSGLRMAHMVDEWVDWGTPEKILASGASIAEGGT